MSNKCVGWAIDQNVGSTPRKLILLLLADLADEQLTCFPGRAWLADHAEMSEGAVSRAISQLSRDGYVRVLRRARKRGGRTSNRYLIMMYGTETPLPDVDDWVSVFDAGDDEPAGQGNGDAGAPLPGADDEPAGQGNSDAGAPLPGDGNGDRGAHSYVTEEHVSKKEENYPPGVTQHQTPPPPTATAATPGTGPEAADDSTVNDSAVATVPTPAERVATVAGLDAARRVLREVTVGVDVMRLPTAAERDRLVTAVAALISAGWSGDTLAARLAGMGTLTTVASVYAVLNSRLRNVGPPPPPPVTFTAPPAALPWCAAPGCDRTTRRLIDAEGRPMFGHIGDNVRVPLWCPDCSGR